MGRIEKLKGRWIHFDAYVNQAVNNEVSKYVDKIALAQSYNNFSNKDRYTGFIGVYFNPTSKFGQFVEKLAVAKEAANDPKVIAAMKLNNSMANCTDNYQEIPDKIDFNESSIALKEDYPLFKYVDWDYYGISTGFNGALTEYIRGVDSSRQLVKEAV